jgi:hypothetical protein
VQHAAALHAPLQHERPAPHSALLAHARQLPLRHTWPVRQSPSPQQVPGRHPPPQHTPVPPSPVVHAVPVPVQAPQLLLVQALPPQSAALQQSPATHAPLQQVFPAPH